MRIDREKSQILQKVTDEVFKNITGLDIKVSKGQTASIKIIFTKISEGLGIRNEDYFDDVASAYKSYLEWRAPLWWQWKGATVESFIPVMNNANNIAIYTAKLKTPVKPIERKTTDNLAGKKTSDQWEY
jgi:hypothetical protein